jgi:hypothetical protein
VERDLSEGDYTVHVGLSFLAFFITIDRSKQVRLDRKMKEVISSIIILILSSSLMLVQNYMADYASWDHRKVSRVLTAKAQSQSIASSMLI